MKDSMIKRTKQTKMAALVGKLALQIAQKSNDPMFEKYQTYRQKYLEFKKDLIKKYMMKAKSAAKKAIQK